LWDTFNAPTVKELRKNVDAGVKQRLENEKAESHSSAGKLKTIDNVLSRYNIKPLTEENIAKVGRSFLERAEAAAQKSAEYQESGEKSRFTEYVAIAAADIKKQARSAELPEQAATRTAASINGNIRPMKKQKFNERQAHNAGMSM
jgi:hypothetical protein